MEEHQCDDALKELVIRLDKRVETIERQQASVSKKLDQLIDLMSSSAGGGLNTAVKKEVEEDFVVSLTIIAHSKLGGAFLATS